MEGTNQGHCWWKMLLIILHLPVFGLVLTFGYFANAPARASNALNQTQNATEATGGVFISDTGEMSDKYSTLITPAGWTFLIWTVIFILQVIHIVYSLTLLCRRNTAGEYLYNAKRPPIHFSFYIVFIFNNGINVSWLFVFDREYLIVALTFLILTALTTYICGAIVAISLNKATPMLERSGKTADVWLTRLLTINGIAFYGAWASIATLLNIAIVMIYRGGVDPVTSCWVVLGILTAKIVAWFIMEAFIFDRYLRYIFSPYLVLMIAFSGIIDKHWVNEVPGYIYYVAALMAVSGLLFLVKILVMIIRGYKHPIENTDESGEFGKDKLTTRF